MPTPRVKFITIFIFYLIISVFIFFFITIFFYDQNSFLNNVENIFEDKINQLFKGKYKPLQDKIVKINTKKTNKYLIINIQDKIDSEYFSNLIYFLYDSNIRYVILDVNFNMLLDSFNDENLKIFMNDNANFFGIVIIKNNKGIRFIPDIYANNTQIYRNFNLIKKTGFPSFLTNFYGEIVLDNRFSISPEKIGCFSRTNNILDSNNIDILYKFDSKYLFSLPFLIYLNNNKIQFNNINFDYLKIYYTYKNIYYDQKARASFRQNFDMKKNIKVVNLKEWDIFFHSRLNIAKSMKNLQIINNNNIDFKNYKNQEDKINSIYEIKDLNNKEQNEILINAKNQASIWKGFKSVNSPELKDTYIFITQKNNYQWVYDFTYKYKIINYGINYLRIPIILIYLNSLLLILLFSLLLINIKKRILASILIFITLNIINLGLYLFLRIFQSIDFPFLLYFITSIYCIIFGTLLGNYYSNLWIKEVKAIYKGSISIKHTEIIANNWKNKKWEPSSKSYTCSFMQIDTSIFLKRDINEEYVEYIGLKVAEIEKIIKDNLGVRNTFTSSEILCYFGNPSHIKSHADIALKTADEINNLTIIPDSIENLTIAIHSKDEWFRYIKKDNQKMYTYFGNSLFILSCMTRLAKEFNISVIISDSTYKLITHKENVRMLDRVKLSGIKGSIRLFEYIEKNKFSNDNNFYDYFHAGLKLFEKKKWEEAGAYFRQCLKINENDTPSIIYLRRCKDFIINPPDKDWDGIFEIK